MPICPFCTGRRGFLHPFSGGAYAAPERGDAPMPSLTFQPLNMMECLDVLRATAVTRAAFCDGEHPYVVPLAFQLDCEGMTPVIHLCMPDSGRKVDCLRRCDRVCLEFESPGCAWVDVVLLEGMAALDAWEKDAGIALHVRAEEMSGRRFFLPGE